MLLVVRPAQTAGQFQILRDVVIGLTEARIGIQHIGILAQEIIVAFIVEAGERIGIDIGACIVTRGRPNLIGVLEGS